MSIWTKLDVENLTTVPDLETLELSTSGLVLKCNFNGDIKNLTFNEHYAFRYISEGDAFGILNEQNFDGNGWLFKNNNSDLSTWFDEESCNVHKDTYTSYVFVSTDDIVEILSKIHPVISA